MQQVNPFEFDKIEDITKLKFLNEASILYNLRQRYNSDLIYVIFFYLKNFTKKKINLDLLWIVLCCNKSLQKIANLFRKYLPILYWLIKLFI